LQRKKGRGWGAPPPPPQFTSLAAPNDGDCLFYSFFVSTLCLDWLKQARGKLGQARPGTQLSENGSSGERARAGWRP